MAIGWVRYLPFIGSGALALAVIFIVVARLQWARHGEDSTAPRKSVLSGVLFGLGLACILTFSWGIIGWTVALSFCVLMTAIYVLRKGSLVQQAWGAGWFLSSIPSGILLWYLHNAGLFEKAAGGALRLP